ncbi:VCBS repeat-containing protein [Marinirhabdus gelatinilytica]|uniref:VCBS repeat protein n=1 Tax=Marinirhabdus gelatinilytica TaxID=1703343 RepID=A0A370QEN4_9FLAO|nr:VCBS repeat-containing protein [Marinirhabdus gelatinilytica]RDK86825.1 VCBS repeat protein [Marinirhabdus gelatinilytica]
MRAIYSIILVLIFLGCDNTKETSGETSVLEKETPEKLFIERSSDTTQLDFKNTVIETETENYDTFPFIYNGAGVAVGDLNNDGLADIYFAGNSVDDKLYFNKGDLVFEDVSATAGISPHKGWSTGVTMVDINADGWLDIYVCRSGPSKEISNKTNKLFVNNQDGTFTESAAAYGISSTDQSIQSAFFDYDLDGDLDMYLLNHPAKKREQSLTFSQHAINVKAGKTITDAFYENVNGVYVDKTKEANLFSYGYRHGIAIGDVNKDGYPDMYISSDFDDADILYINQKNKTFKNTVDNAFGHISFNSMGNELIDINNDSHLDIYVMDMAPSDHFRSKAYMMSMDVDRFWSLVRNGMHHQYMFNTYQLNNGNGTFSEVGQLSGTAKTDWSWAPLFFDMDHDGYKDLFVTNGIKENFLYRDIKKDANEKFGKGKSLSLKEFLDVVPSDISENIFYKNVDGVTFKNMNSTWSPPSLYNSNGVATADFDNDGDLDFVMNNMDSSAVLYESTAANGVGGNSIKLKLKGSELNPQAIGAKVKVTSQGQEQWHELYITRGYLSSVDSPLIFGLGEANTATVEVQWPLGTVSTLKDVSANKTYEIAFTEATNSVPMTPMGGDKILSKVEPNGLNYKHKEDAFDEYTVQILLPHSQSTSGPTISKGDVNGDGTTDIFIGGASGQEGSLYLQNGDGSFTARKGDWFKHSIAEDTGSLFLDFDNDGDLDLYVVSGGTQKPEGHFFYQDRMYVNDGNGNFLYSSKTLPELTVSGKTVISSDVDNDGDIDLFVGGRVIPNGYPKAAKSYFLINEDGTFVPKEMNVGNMVSAALFSDYDGDGDKDLLTVGEWSSINIFKNDGGEFNRVHPPSLTQTTGLWFGLNEHDIDSDGDMDYFVGNLGANAKFKVDKDHEFHIYGNDFDDNGTYDIVLSSNYQGNLVPSRGRECSSQQMPFIKEKFKDFTSFASASLEDIYGEKLLESLHYQADLLYSVFLKNNGNGDFEIIKLPWQLQVAPVTDFEFVDIDNNNETEILAVGNLYNVEVETQRYDAFKGAVFSYTDEGFQVHNPLETGFFTSGDARDVTTLKISEGTVIVVTNNNGALDIFRLHKKEPENLAVK